MDIASSRPHPSPAVGWERVEMPAMSKVGILGSGDVGKQLGRGLAKHGFDVMLGSRDPAKLEPWRKETKGKVSTGTFAQAAAHGSFVILALSGAATEAAIDLAGGKNFAGKLVIDATNPLDFSKGMPPTLFVGTTDSLAERVQRKLPDAKVVKCFNTVSNTRMVDPKFRDGTPPMLICGNDAGAKKHTEEVLRELGWPGALDVGGIEGARWLEALVPLWVRAAQVLNTYEHAFKVVQ
jgi:8-hydroxy-5-deazaflavin:NADPH oxidoreductase